MLNIKHYSAQEAIGDNMANFFSPLGAPPSPIVGASPLQQQSGIIQQQIQASQQAHALNAASRLEQQKMAQQDAMAQLAQRNNERDFQANQDFRNSSLGIQLQNQGLAELESQRAESEFAMKQQAAAGDQQYQDMLRQALLDGNEEGIGQALAIKDPNKAQEWQINRLKTQGQMTENFLKQQELTGKYQEYKLAQGEQQGKIYDWLSQVPAEDRAKLYENNLDAIIQADPNAPKTYDPNYVRHWGINALSTKKMAEAQGTAMGASGGPGGKLSIEEQKRSSLAVTALEGLKEARAMYDDVQKSASWDPTGLFGGFGKNFAGRESSPYGPIKSELRQKYDQAVDAIITNLGYLRSGATITEAEYQRAVTNLKSDPNLYSKDVSERGFKYAEKFLQQVEDDINAGRRKSTGRIGQESAIVAPGPITGQQAPLNNPFLAGPKIGGQ